MPVLGLPLLLVGLAALPMVAGIYWLRTRFRRQEVSTLFLWRSAVDAQGGGRKKSRMQTPLALLLELLAILLLVLAATAPRVLRGGHTAVVTVVLDDSYSMTAVDDTGSDARQRATDILRDELDRLRRYRVRVIAAGAEPRVLGEPATAWAEVEAALTAWRGEAAVSDLGAAVALATEIGGPRQRLLVLTDHAMPAALRDGAVLSAEDETASTDPENPAVTPDPNDVATAWGRLRWVSVGRSTANVAIVNAVRSPDAVQGDTVLVELSNLSDTATQATLNLSVGSLDAVYATDETADALGELQPLSRSTVELPAGVTRRLWLRPDAAGRPLVIDLADDAVATDNRVVLMPPATRPLPVAVEVEDAGLGDALTQALQASGRASVVAPSDALLTFTDAPPPQSPATGSTAGPRWTVRFDRGVGTADNTEAYLGPFVIDFEHAMTEGLSLAGLVWAVGAEETDDEGVPVAEGRPVITAGNVVLLRDEARRDGTHRLTWRLRPEGSTWLQSAALPIAVWNLIDWRQRERPGVSPVNARPGVPISIATNVSRGEASVSRVGGEATAGEPTASGEVLPIDNRRATWVADRAGVYEIVAEGRRHRVAIHAASSAESDLRGATTEDFGEWDDQVAVVNEYQGLAWVLGLLALGVLGLHAWLLFKPASGRAPNSPTLVPGAIPGASA